MKNVVKSVIIFQKISDFPTFEELLVKQIMPEFLKVSGLSRIQVTKYHPHNQPIPNNLKPIQVVLDLYWESIDAMQQFVESPEGAKASTLVMNNPYSQAGAFMCKESSFTPNQNSSIEL
jgi:hypothetical protein